MLGVYDFCGHYEWTFAWLEQRGGKELLQRYWDKAIHKDSQQHAAKLISERGFAGMQEYWGHSLVQEGAGYKTSATDKVFRIDIHECPSKGFLLRNKLEQHSDYCDHCIGWIGPMLKKSGFTIDHQHNHCGQCWWEIRKANDATIPSGHGELAGADDVRLSPTWKQTAELDSFYRANHPDQKQPS